MFVVVWWLIDNKTTWASGSFRDEKNRMGDQLRSMRHKTPTRVWFIFQARKQSFSVFTFLWMCSFLQPSKNLQDQHWPSDDDDDDRDLSVPSCFLTGHIFFINCWNFQPPFIFPTVILVNQILKNNANHKRFIL